MSTPAAKPASVINLKSLRWSLALLAGACLVAGAAGIVAFRLGEQTTALHKQVLAQQAETRSRLARANDDEREIRSKIDRYQEILQHGRTQPERRLEWVESLRAIKQSRRLLDLDYEIAPQRALDERNRISGGYEFLASPMKFDLSMLHEGDLVGLLDDLAANTQALTSVKSCKIERIVSSPVAQGGANLKASCEMDWITLREKL